MNIPKLLFYYAYPFDGGRRRLFLEKGLGLYPSRKEVMQKVGEYRALLEEVNKDDRVIKLLVEKSGTTLPRDLEVWVFGAGMNAMSSPFLVPAFKKVGVPFTRNQLIEMFIHETTHRFVGNSENNVGLIDYWKAVREEYANESSTTQNHIIVYALLSVVLRELFGDESLKDFINPNDPDYKRAVEIVAEKGAENLVKQFKNYLV